MQLVRDAIHSKDFHPRIPEYEGFDNYKAGGGYDELAALRAGSRTADAVQQDVLDSGLRGMGGAGFPSGRKWSFVKMNDGPRFLAVNGDEGEPGTFKDRYFLEREPHVFLEGMLIAGWAIEAETCYIYMRDEYPAIIEILKTEIAKLEAAGIVEPGHVELRRGAGAYICGEESAMIESIEGKRGPAAASTAVCRIGRHLRSTDPRSQCRDAALGVQDRARRPGRVRGSRDQWAQGATKLLGIGACPRAGRQDCTRRRHDQGIDRRSLRRNASGSRIQGLSARRTLRRNPARDDGFNPSRF